MPYMGWSAGANVACPTLRTTNDMPIIQPERFDCFNVIKFQINPHYLDANPQGHGGETREQRINEFLSVNRNVTVVGLRESTALWLEHGEIRLVGNRPMRLFAYGNEPREYQPGDNISFLL
jgi:dipeptidase E